MSRLGSGHPIACHTEQEELLSTDNFAEGVLVLIGAGQRASWSKGVALWLQLSRVKFS